MGGQISSRKAAWRLLSWVLAAIVICETAVHLIVAHGSLDEIALQRSIVDAVLLAVLLYPALYVGIYRPLLREIAARERVERNRDVFIHGVTHDVRNPLASIRVQAELLQRKLQNDVTLAKHLGRSIDNIAMAAQRIDAIIADLVDCSRLEGRRMSTGRERVRLQDFVSEVLKRHEGVLDTQRCQVELQCDNCTVEADPSHLERVIVNLVSNAIKYSRPDSPVTIRVSESEANAVIAVEDQGEGIAPAELSRVFDQFFRGSSARCTQGLGLGLYIAKSLVEMNHGRLTVQSIPGKGSVFSLSLPKCLSRGLPKAG